MGYKAMYEAARSGYNLETERRQRSEAERDAALEELRKLREFITGRRRDVCRTCVIRGICVEGEHRLCASCALTAAVKALESETKP